MSEERTPRKSTSLKVDERPTDAWFDFKMAAALPVYGVPGLTRL